jgi:hypothetical protein
MKGEKKRKSSRKNAKTKNHSLEKGRKEDNMAGTVDYRDVGLQTYGNRCEICGYGVCLEVHHTHYQEHQDLEDQIRAAFKAGKDITSLLDEAKAQGWTYFDKKTLQLDKGNQPNLLSVLCGNCHSLVHKMDVGLKLLKALSPRK